MGGTAPQPHLLGCHSLRGAQGPASAPGSAGHHAEGPWPLCICSGPCGGPQGWRGSAWLGHGSAYPSRPRGLAEPHWWHPSGVPSGSPHTSQAQHRVSIPPDHCQASGHPRSPLFCWGLCYPYSLTPHCLGHGGLPRPLFSPPPVQAHWQSIRIPPASAQQSLPYSPSQPQWLQPSPVYQCQDVEHGGHIRVAVA